MQTEHSPFPSDETLAAYSEGRLDEETRKHVTEHMAECPECFDVVMGNMDMAVATEPPAANVVRWPRNVVATLAAAAAVAVVVFLTPVRDRVWPRDDIAALAAVAPSLRIGDGRIAKFPYRPKAQTSRGVGDDSEHEITQFDVVAAQVGVRAAERPTPQTLHAAGVAKLAQRKSDAWKTLESAVCAQTRVTDIGRAVAMSSDASLLSDLAAAYIAAGKYKEAAVAAERAWMLSRSPEAGWNRAVAAELQGQRDAALRDWQDYLSVDKTSAWANEARDRVNKIQHPDTF